MEKETKKQRSPNFSAQDSILLASLMGEPHNKIKMNNHNVCKHRFTQGITSETKREVWRSVEAKFNASATLYRTASVLEKKWENLVSKHRALYSDYKRELNRTGGGTPGPSAGKLSLVTEAVLDVIGRESVSVAGAVDSYFDSTMMIVQNLSTCYPVLGEPTAELDQGSTAVDVTCVTIPTLQAEQSHATPTSTGSSSKRTPCHCMDEELLHLKKRKMKLQIQLLERQLGGLEE